MRLWHGDGIEMGISAYSGSGSDGGMFFLSCNKQGARSGCGKTQEVLLRVAEELA